MLRVHVVRQTPAAWSVLAWKNPDAEDKMYLLFTAATEMLFGKKWRKNWTRNMSIPLTAWAICVYKIKILINSYVHS